MNSFVLGLISDTHGLLRPEAVSALAGSQAIIHAGDVGKPEILDELKRIAPVYAVRGNIDTDAWAKSLPLTETVQLAKTSIYVLHNVSQLDLNPNAAGLKIVVSGHTHKPASQMKDNVLYVNPGSAGPKRFSLPICVAKIDLLKTPWEVDFIDLANS